jgi:hypothetical protein
MNSITVEILYENRISRLIISENDTWCELCDKINEHVLGDMEKSKITRHYDHEMYYVSYYSKRSGTTKLGRCSCKEMPYMQIDPTHLMHINFNLKAVRCCRCFIVPQYECMRCHNPTVVDDNKTPSMVHNLHCGHELFCRRCADIVISEKMNKCPKCQKELRLVHANGKCYKCQRFSHDSTCDFFMDT